MDASLGFFSGFNARHLDAEQVASSFVPSPKFTQLLGLQHSLLIGARGSGKTHMLKMLQPKALNAWNHEIADSVRGGVGYWGVFVPADEAWRHQIESSALALLPEIRSRFRSAIFSTHVQRSVVDCFLQLTHDRPLVDRGFAKVFLTTANESSLCRTLAATWNLQPLVHSLVGIRQALVDRSADLYELSDHEAHAPAFLEKCQTQAIQAAMRGINAFDSTISRFEGRWCLMFDELEIAPEEIQKLLFRSIRSTDHKLLFKLAISPSTEAAEIFKEPKGPSAGNDYDEISLYSDPKEAAIFCESLWRNLAKGTSSEGMGPTSILGHSTFHAPETGNPYAPRGRWQEASSSLARKDNSYREFLNHYKLDPDGLDKASPALKNAVVRKIGPIVGFRNFMLMDAPGTGRREVIRSDKTKPSALYSGWEALCLVSEGNPRWFTGIAKSMIIKSSSGVAGLKLTKAAQYSAIVSSSRKFMDYIATIPSTASSHIPGDEGGLKSLVDALTEAFRGDVLLGEFALEPILSFQVDRETPNWLRQAIFDGLYSGAFIPVGDVERQFAFSRDLIGQRLRVTYLLAPLGMLPLRTGKSRNLTGLLERNKNVLGNQRRRRLKLRPLLTVREPQAKLFNE